MAQGLIVKVKNNTSSTLLFGKAVYITGFSKNDQVPTIDLASANNNSKLPAVGLISEDILSGNIGSIKISGLLNGFNTSNERINSEIYVGENGEILFTDPSIIENNDLIAQQIGVVLTVEENGQILLFPMEFRKINLHALTHKSGKTDELLLEHNSLLEINENQHHNKLHANDHSPSGIDPIGNIYLPRDGSVGMTGSLGIGTDSPDSDAALEISSTTQGFLLSPMSAIQASAISTPNNGLMVHVNTTDATFTSVGFWGRVDGAWIKL